MGGEDLQPGSYDEVEPPGTHFGAGTEQVSRTLKKRGTRDLTNNYKARGRAGQRRS